MENTQHSEKTASEQQPKTFLYVVPNLNTDERGRPKSFMVMAGYHRTPEPNEAAPRTAVLMHRQEITLADFETQCHTPAGAPGTAQGGCAAPTHVHGSAQSGGACIPPGRCGSEPKNQGGTSHQQPVATTQPRESSSAASGLMAGLAVGGFAFLFLACYAIQRNVTRGGAVNGGKK